MTPREALEQVISPEMANELIKHRQRLRKPMTDFAAKLLAKKLAQCPDPTAAAEMMIEKGWQSIEPAWFANAQQRALPSPSSVSSVFSGLVAQMERSDGIRRIQGSAGVSENVPCLPFTFEE